MNLEFKGKPELIRSVEEGSRLLLSENNNNQDGSLTIILEESLDAAKTSIEKKDHSCTIRFQDPVLYQNN